ncbi:MAG: FeoB-associated Cys-rich membrane protein [Clostridiales bacterium]|nr:FeoB-associated Cys-rich membrane protein [Clostridiales bacterium]
MGDLFWLDYLILIGVGLLVVVVLFFSFRDSRKRKSSGCSGHCDSCSYSGDIKSEKSPHEKSSDQSGHTSKKSA